MKDEKLFHHGTHDGSISAKFFVVMFGLLKVGRWVYRCPRKNGKCRFIRNDDIFSSPAANFSFEVSWASNDIPEQYQRASVDMVDMYWIHLTSQQTKKPKPRCTNRWGIYKSSSTFQIIGKNQKRKVPLRIMVTYGTFIWNKKHRNIINRNGNKTIMLDMYV